MPVIIPDNHPANDVLREKGVFVINSVQAAQQDIRPLRIALLNLMPLKQDTEAHFFRLVGNTSLQVEPILLRTETYEPTNTSTEHLEEFYETFSEAKKGGLDGLIVTGANVELLPFEDVSYWKELCDIFDWAKYHIASTIGVCWGAQAGLHHYYGIEKYRMSKKIYGVFNYTHEGRNDLLRGLDDVVRAPVSIETEVRREDVLACNDLEILLDSVDIGPGIIASKELKFIAVPVHFEYDRGMLAREWIRDMLLGKNSTMPKNYFSNEAFVEGCIDGRSVHEKLDIISKLPQELREEIFALEYFPKGTELRNSIEAELNSLVVKNKNESLSNKYIKAWTPRLSWRSGAEVLYRNWVNYVYQVTPFKLPSCS